VQQPLIFDIRRYSINDGPGIRLTLFFKGCPLSCLWCHNPESISPHQQKMFNSGRCIACGECVKVCPRDALQLSAAGLIADPLACALCGQCAQVCPARAIEMVGRTYDIAELMEMVDRERIFFEESGGGVTISGGEPLLHPSYLLQLLKACGLRGVHRAVDTSGFCDQDVLLAVAQHTDLFLYDLKLIDDVLHRKYTGVSNKRIIENLQALSASGAAIQIRIPVIGTVNADEEHARALADVVAGLDGEKKTVHLLPYHGIAAGKYQRLGEPDRQGALREPTSRELTDFEACFSDQGLSVVVGG